MIYDFHSCTSVIYHLNFNTVFKQCRQREAGACHVPVRGLGQYFKLLVNYLPSCLPPHDLLLVFPWIHPPYPPPYIWSSSLQILHSFLLTYGLPRNKSSTPSFLHMVLLATNHPFLPPYISFSPPFLHKENDLPL